MTSLIHREPPETAEGLLRCLRPRSPTPFSLLRWALGGRDGDVNSQMFTRVTVCTIRGLLLSEAIYYI